MDQYDEYGNYIGEELESEEVSASLSIRRLFLDPHSIRRRNSMLMKQRGKRTRDRWRETVSLHQSTIALACSLMHDLP